jgi:phosphohistidine phosphatase
MKGSEGMEIYLMQHGSSLPKEEDPEEGLSPEGEEGIHASGKALKKMGVRFDAILSSPKKRSQQTAAIIAEETGFPPEEIIETERIKAMTPPEDTIKALGELSHYKSILIAGHLPSVAEVASFLLTEGSKAAIEFERGGCCRIDAEDIPTHSGRLRWYLTPDQLRLIAS